LCRFCQNGPDSCAAGRIFSREICDGLSYGLAKNIVDAVFSEQEFSTVVAAGGVALNKAVIKHIENLAHLMSQ